ncbi:hypothetical protein D9M72_528950 [compost metagenome]
MKRILARTQFLKSDDGGRAQAIPVMSFRCPIFFEGVDQLSGGFDCRLLVDEVGHPISPGEMVESLPIVFLSPDKIFPYLSAGVRFTLWERGEIARGVVLRIE